MNKYRPDLLGFSTTNGDHCTGDGIKMSEEIGASLVDMEYGLFFIIKIYFIIYIEFNSYNK